MTYESLQYIESSGTQYINTGYYPNINTDCEYSCRQVATMVSNQAQTFFGVSDGAWNNNAYAVSTYQFGSYGFGNSGSDGWASFTITKDVDTILRLNKNCMYKDGILCRSNTSYSKSSQNRPLFFFAANYSSITELGKHRLYYAKIWDNGVLVRDYVPKLRHPDLIPGLYDNVNNTFVQNSGTGAFIYG